MSRGALFFVYLLISVLTAVLLLQANSLSWNTLDRLVSTLSCLRSDDNSDGGTLKSLLTWPPVEVSVWYLVGCSEDRQWLRRYWQQVLTPRSPCPVLQTWTECSSHCVITSMIPWSVSSQASCQSENILACVNPVCTGLKNLWISQSKFVLPLSPFQSSDCVPALVLPVISL